MPAETIDPDLMTQEQADADLDSLRQACRAALTAWLNRPTKGRDKALDRAKRAYLHEWSHGDDEEDADG